jgi:hypothetical protein
MALAVAVAVAVAVALAVALGIARGYTPSAQVTRACGTRSSKPYMTLTV